MLSGFRTRQTCGFFVPVNQVRLISYDGMIGPNTRPSGNKSSRLSTVVESRHPFGDLTKCLGGHHDRSTS